MRRLPLVLASVLLPLAVARADGPGDGYVYKDAERFGRAPAARPAPYGFDERTAGGGRFPGFPPSRFDRGPGYVGSDWGLGRPAPTGLGTRPDWGRSDF